LPVTDTNPIPAAPQAPETSTSNTPSAADMPDDDLPF